MNPRTPRPEDPLDAALADSFPASDAPARTASLVATPAAPANGADARQAAGARALPGSLPPRIDPGRLH